MPHVASVCVRRSCERSMSLVPAWSSLAIRCPEVLQSKERSLPSSAHGSSRVRRPLGEGRVGTGGIRDNCASAGRQPSLSKLRSQAAPLQPFKGRAHRRPSQPSTPHLHVRNIPATRQYAAGSLRLHTPRVCLRKGSRPWKVAGSPTTNSLL